MRIFTVITAAYFVFSPVCLFAQDTFVRGYTRSDGSYVQPHYRTERNSTQYDNYSTEGNTNPYNGRQGYVVPDENDNRSYNSDNNNYQPQQPNSYGNNNGFFGQDNRKKKSGSFLDND